MSKPIGSDQTVSILLGRLNAGDDTAREKLIERAGQRLEALTHKQLKGFSLVRRWEDTSDVAQGAMIRLYRALETVRPASTRDFFGLSSQMIRRELLDLKRHYYGAQGMGAHHYSQAGLGKDASNAPLPAAEAIMTKTLDPAALAEWTDFHNQVELLPMELKEVVNLLWYQELSQDEAAEIVGVDSRTIRRRWREARMLIGKYLRS